MDSKTFLTGYRSTSRQVEKKQTNLFPHIASRETLLTTTTQSCQRVSESSAQQPATTDWIVDNNDATAKLVRRLDSDFNPTELLQHTSHRRMAFTTFTRARLPTASGCEQATKRRLSTWQGAKLKNTIKKKIKKTELSFTQTRISEHW